MRWWASCHAMVSHGKVSGQQTHVMGLPPLHFRFPYHPFVKQLHRRTTCGSSAFVHLWTLCSQINPVAEVDLCRRQAHTSAIPLSVIFCLRMSTRCALKTSKITRAFWSGFPRSALTLLMYGTSILSTNATIEFPLLQWLSVAYMSHASHLGTAHLAISSGLSCRCR